VRRLTSVLFVSLVIFVVNCISESALARGGGGGAGHGGGGFAHGGSKDFVRGTDGVHVAQSPVRNNSTRQFRFVDRFGRATFQNGGFPVGPFVGRNGGAGAWGAWNGRGSVWGRDGWGWGWGSDSGYPQTVVVEPGAEGQVANSAPFPILIARAYSIKRCCCLRRSLSGSSVSWLGY
jgi:hypothetical protein